MTAILSWREISQKHLMSISVQSSLNQFKVPHAFTTCTLDVSHWDQDNSYPSCTYPRVRVVRNPRPCTPLLPLPIVWWSQCNLFIIYYSVCLSLAHIGLIAYITCYGSRNNKQSARTYMKKLCMPRHLFPKFQFQNIVNIVHQASGVIILKSTATKYGC